MDPGQGHGVKRLVVVGGGIAGLAAAWRAKTGGAAGSAVEVTLVEQDTRLGGKILTEERNGCILDAGADGFLSRKPAGIQLCRELAVLDLLRGQLQRARRSFVSKDGVLHPLPEGFSGLVPADPRALEDTTLLTQGGRERALREPDIPADPATRDESIAQFMTRRFGREAFQVLMEPLLSGIFAGDAERISLQATFPHLRELELRHGSIMRGLQEAAREKAAQEKTAQEKAAQEEAAREQEAAATPRSPFVTFGRGMGELITVLSVRLAEAGVRVLAGDTCVGIHASGGGYVLETVGGGTFQADAVVVAVPPASAAALLRRLDSDLGGLLAGISSASTAVIHAAFRRGDIQHDLDGYGYVVPRTEGSDALACTWSSSKWPGRAPPEIALLRLYAGRHGGQEVLERTDAELVFLARKELARVMGIEAEPLFSRVFRWPSALPQYAMDHLQRISAVESFRKNHQGLFLAGAAYRGVGIPDCIDSGFQAAQAALRSLAHEVSAR